MLLLRIFAVLLVATGLWAQQAATKKATASKTLTVDQVISMVKAGLSDDVIITKLRKENHAFDLDSDDLIKLKTAHVSDGVVKVMLDPTASAAPPQAAPAAVPQQVIVAPGVPGGLVGIGGTARASGATPAPGTEANGDPNDPMTPHDSGIYLFTKDRDGKPQMVVLERAAYTGAKTGGMIGSALTYGIKKVKTKAVIAGAKANQRVADHSPVFYFYFDDKQAGLGKTYFGVGNLSNPNQFALLKLEVKGSNRETVIGAYSSLGSSSGEDTKAMVQFKSERVRPGLYKVTVADMNEGEYCFMASGENVVAAGPYGAATSRANSADLFDFGVGFN